MNENEIIYKNKKTIVTIKCKKCGFERTRPICEILKYKYSSCIGLAYTDESFKIKVKENIGNEYEILGNYKNKKEKLLVRHNYPEVRMRDLIKNQKIINSNKYSLLHISYKEINHINEILTSILLDKSSKTIRKYNLYYISKNSKIYNAETYYNCRSTFQNIEVEKENFNKYNLLNEDIVFSYVKA